jgi:DNA-binding NarL/FixJ family response regulator
MSLTSATPDTSSCEARDEPTPTNHRRARHLESVQDHAPGSAAAPLRVAVLSRHQLTRAGLVQLLSHDPDRSSVVEGPVRRGAPGGVDVVVCDLSEHGDFLQDDLAVLLSAGVPVVALVSPGDAEAALETGVVETVQLDVDGPGLIEALERAVAASPVTRAAPRLPATRQDHLLTDRELTILTLIASGVTNKDIAAQLYLSINTVKSYIRSAYRKIGSSRRSEAVLWAVRHDLVANL